MSYLVNKLNKIYLEDCLDRLNKKSTYDYAFFSPPDYDEMNLHPKQDEEEYSSFINRVLGNLNPSKQVVTVVISDRVQESVTKQVDREVKKVEPEPTSSAKVLFNELFGE